MFKKFISVLCMFFGILTAAHAGPAANIEYVHKMIAHVWGIEIPYNPELKNPRYAANMEYLLAAVDVANEMLNGYKTTDYKSDPKYATRYIADTLATNKAVHELIKMYYPFNMHIKPTDSNKTFNFNIAARGKFYVDWGDGSREIIDLTDINLSNNAWSGDSHQVSHTYSSAGEYTVSLGGHATEYETYDWVTDDYSTLSQQESTFYTESKILVGVSGHLGRVFPTLKDGSNPNFAGGFMYSGLQSVGADLFKGITGKPTPGMFAGLFYMCKSLTTVPSGLFTDLDGSTSLRMFENMFYDSALTQIPDGMFAGLDKSQELAELAFYSTFSSCDNLTGPSAQLDGRYLYKIWPNVSDFYTYSGATGLTDYPCIPTAWGGGGGTGPSCVTQDDMGRFSADINITEDYRRNVGFNLRAAGRFIIDWGDGTVEEFINTEDVFDDSSAVRREHEYAEVGEYTITISGLATQYADMDPFGNSLPSAWEHTFNFYGMGYELVGVSGKIGSVFPTLADGSNPNFGGLFSSAQMETVPADLFDGIHGQASFAMFAGMFMGSEIKEIPVGLFDGITGGSNYMFYGFCEGCMNLDTVSGDVFKFANDLEPTYEMFYSAFGWSSLKEIPAGLFDDVVGEPASGMFYRTFTNCTELTGEIPAGLFAGISGTPKNDMFRETFSGDSGLTGEIPDDLFGNISGTLSQWDSFSSMFAGCTGLTGMSAKIDGTLLYEIWPDATSNQVGGMYYNCTGLTDYPCIPTIWGGLGTDTDCKIENVIVESTTRPDVAEWPFEMKTVDLDAGGEIGIGLALVGDVYIDWGDGNYTTINMMGDYQSELIEHEYATAGEYTIKIAANPRKYFSGMDWTTFFVWPNESLASIDGSLGRVFPTLSNGSNPCFAYAFESAANLTGEIPADLFDGIHGQPNDYMYAGLFAGCSGLTGEIPDDLFGNISGEPAGGMFSSTFSNCVGLTGPSAKIGNNYLYEIWPDATEEQVGGMYWGARGLSDWCQIPDQWRGGADPLCDSSDAEFAVHVKTTSANSTFEFRLGAAGEFTVDWGDGTVETIVKDNTDRVIYSHPYANAGDYAFGISGQATAYPTEYATEYTDATFTFRTNNSNTEQIYNIRGSLGHVFGTLADGSQPRFSSLFQYADNLRIVVPENLFDGIYGQPIPHMFAAAFRDSGITGVAGPLFANISGTPTEGLYAYTFDACYDFSDEVPMGMFGNLTGDLAQGTFYETFIYAYGIFGHSARDANGRYLYEVWPDATRDQVWGMYCDDAGLIDIDRIPSVWLGNCGPV